MLAKYLYYSVELIVCSVSKLNRNPTKWESVIGLWVTGDRNPTYRIQNECSRNSETADTGF